jgi:photosystem II stability/assembly factor-like uncharacterized protein
VRTTFRSVLVALLLGLALAWPTRNAAAAGTWTPIHLPHCCAFADLAVAPNAPGTIYVPSLGEVFKSLDGGETWTIGTSGLPVNLDQAAGQGGTHVLVVDPRNSDVTYMASFSGIFKSTDGGMTWSPRNDGLTDLSIWALVIDPITPDILYATTSYRLAPTTALVYKSTDAGQHWGLVLPDQPRERARQPILTVDPRTPTTLYLAGFRRGLLRTTDGGATWTQEAEMTFSSPVTTLAIAPGSPNTIYVGLEDKSAAITTDGGKSWNMLTVPFPASPFTNYLVSLAVDSADWRTVYAGTILNGVLRSTDAGAHWSDFSVGLDSELRNVWSLQFTQNGPKVLYASTLGGLFKWEFTSSTDMDPPSCVLTKVGTNNAGQKYIEVTTQDDGSGLQTITATISTNVQVSIPSFPKGSTNPIVVTGTKVDQSKPSQLALRLTDLAGNITDCDPVLVSVTVDKMPPTPVTLTDLPQAEHVLTITNGKPGLQRLQVAVNGKPGRTIRLRAGQRQTVDLKAAFKRGDGNTLVLTPVGPLKASADVLVWDGKSSGEPTGKVHPSAKATPPHPSKQRW